VKELSAPLHTTPPAITKHHKVLESAGLITRGRKAQWRPCTLDAGPLRDISDWVEQYRAHWEQRLDRLDAYLQEVQQSKAGQETNPTKAAKTDTSST